MFLREINSNEEQSKRSGFTFAKGRLRVSKFVGPVHLEIQDFDIIETKKTSVLEENKQK